MAEISEGSLVKGIITASFRDDPESAGRLQVYIPSIHGEYNQNRVGPATTEESAVEKYPWAQCMTQMGLYSVPKVGATVWIVFEANNPRLPVVIGMHTAGISINDNETLGAGQQGTGISGGTLAEIAAEVIFGNEGGYTTVNWNDNGAISIGKIQWHANHARDLLNDIKNKNPSQFTSMCPNLDGYLGQSWNNMKNWSSGCTVGREILAILATNESKQAQDESAIAFVQGYIDDIQKRGVTNPQVTIYLADISNQGPAIGNDFAKYSSTNNVTTLDAVHNNTMSHKPYYNKWINGDSPYRARRKRTYDKIKELESQGKFTENGLTNMAGMTGAGLLGWPVPGVGYISSPFGWRGAISGTSHKGANFHNGIDIAAAAGTKIVSAQDGTVYVNKFNDGGYGWYVVIKNDQYMTLYGHMRSQSPLPLNSTVKRGDYVGPMGTTGNSSGPHCHFTVIPTAKFTGYFGGQNSNAIDPMTVVQKP